MAKKNLSRCGQGRAKGCSLSPARYLCYTLSISKLYIEGVKPVSIQKRLKTAKLSLRIEPGLKKVADRAAAADHRLLTSSIEKLLTDHLRAKGYLPATADRVLLDPTGRMDAVPDEIAGLLKVAALLIPKRCARSIQA